MIRRALPSKCFFLSLIGLTARPTKPYYVFHRRTRSPDVKNTIISGTYHFDPRYALRFGLSANFSETTYQYVGGSQNGSSTSTASAILDGLWYLNPGNPIKIYCGLGAAAGLSTSGWPAPILVPPYNWNVGVRGCLGTEWFFTKNLSLWAEYGASLGYAFGLPTSSVSNGTGTATSQTVVNFTPTPIKFGLSVYIGP